MADIDKKTYLELILNFSVNYVREAGKDSVCSLIDDGLDLLDEKLHDYVTGVLARADHLEDILKASGRTDPDPSVWRDAVNWPEVLFRAAYLMVLEDLKEQVVRMCRESDSILTAPAE